MTLYIIIVFLIWFIIGGLYLFEFEPSLTKPKIWEIVLLFPVFLLGGIAVVVAGVIEYLSNRKEADK